MRRTAAGFLRETFEATSAVVHLEAIECQLPLSELYDRVDFSLDSLREEAGTTSREFSCIAITLGKTSCVRVKPGEQPSEILCVESFSG